MTSMNVSSDDIFRLSGVSAVFLIGLIPSESHGLRRKKIFKINIYAASPLDNLHPFSTLHLLNSLIYSVSHFFSLCLGSWMLS